MISNYQYVVFQDDDILSWQALYGIKVLGPSGESAMPWIRSALKSCEISNNGALLCNADKTSDC
ncbi:MAG: hypothetical protein RXR30_04070 [Nitrososphaeria archaeon]